MTDKFCGQCGKPLLKPIEREVKPTWGLAWGLMWRQWLLALAVYIVLGLLALFVYALHEMVGVSV